MACHHAFFSGCTMLHRKLLGPCFNCSNLSTAVFPVAKLLFAWQGPCAVLPHQLLPNTCCYCTVVSCSCGVVSCRCAMLWCAVLLCCSVLLADEPTIDLDSLQQQQLLIRLHTNSKHMVTHNHTL
jgi:hypothetical protein